MNDTTNRQQQPIQDEETTSPNIVNVTGVETSQRRISVAASCSNPSHNQEITDEEEQIVTSTSNENCGPTSSSSYPYPYSQTNQLPVHNLHNFVTSPARITSSTGNDYSSSPIQQHNTTQGILSTSEDDSTEQQQQLQQIKNQNQNHQQQDQQQHHQLQQQHRLNQQEEDYSALNVAMPTTSAAAAAAKNKNHDNVADETPTCNHLTSTRRIETCDKPSTSLPRKSTETKEIDTPSNMVARDSGNNLAGSGSTNSGEQTVNHVEKIILKLPKQNESQNVQYQTRHQQQQQQLKQQQQKQKEEPQQEEHFLDNDPSMSNSCSNSSTNSSIIAEADTRKVEPLKINLHHGSQQQQQHQQQLHQFHQHGHQKPPHSPSSSNSSTADSASHVVPKITIKPLFPPKSSSTEGSAFSSDAKASDLLLKQSETSAGNVPIPKLTIKSASENMSSEPHIVPKLTIRAAHEEGGCTHTSVVPKLTIKMSDTQTSHGLHGLHNNNSALSPSNSAGKLVNNTSDLSQQQQQHQQHQQQQHQQQQQQPPLPKLTIKTTLDGASGSSILSSSISPASTSTSNSNSNSSSSAASSPQRTMGTSTSASISKMTLKSMQSKSKDESTPQSPQPVVPKLTIKTSPSGSCVTSAATDTNISDTITDPDGFTPLNKIPKLTIKTGQEHAVIITSQHKNEQTIPKLTIKTKSLDIDNDDDDDPQSDFNKEIEKIPKLTIKSSSIDSLPPPIPKLTISTPHSPKSHSSGSSAQSLVVRQVVANTPLLSPSSSSKIHSPDRVPKLMISRQESINHGSIENQNEKIVPKLTIKTTTSASSITGGEQNDELRETSAKIPKLTIKTLPSTNSKEELQSSEDSDDGTSVESAQSSTGVQNEQQQQQLQQHQQTNKTVPKLTITNLGSPKLRLKTVSSTDKQPNETVSFGHKKSSKSANVSQMQATETNQLKNVEKASETGKATAPNVVANGGESSSSQEFCGFIENATDSSMIQTHAVQVDNANKVITNSSAMEEAPENRRPSDDMDIDEGLQAHDPKIFKNITHFGAIRNGEAYGIHVTNNLDDLPEQISGLKNSNNLVKASSSEVVDTVDLTSSPSPGSSPAHFNYTDADPKLPEFLNSTSQSNALLLECLQRETSVIQTASRLATSVDHNRSQLLMTATSKEQSNSLLLSQLTAPLRYPPPPPLHPRPPPPQHPHLFNVQYSQNALNYPQLNEHLLANGSHAMMQFPAAPIIRPPSISMSNSMPMLNSTKPPTTVIDSIEILDTPEGSPRSSQDDSQSVGEFPNRLYMDQAVASATEENMLHHNNNIMHHMSASSVDATNNSSTLKRSSKELSSYTNDCLSFPPNKIRRTENITPTMATLTILTNDNSTNSATLITTSPTLIGGANDNNCIQSPKPQSSQCSTNSHHRSRKQKHDNILDVPLDEIEQVNQIAKKATANSPQKNVGQVAENVTVPEVVTPAPAPKKRGRPRRIRPEEQALQNTSATTSTPAMTVNTPGTPNLTDSSAQRRVQLLRKRLAIDMVSAEQLVADVAGSVETKTPKSNVVEEGKIRRERAIRTTRRCGTPNSLLNAIDKQSQLTTPQSGTKQRKQRFVNSSLTTPTANCDVAGGSTVNSFNHFGGSNSSLSSACSSNSSYSTTLTTTANTASTAFMGTVNCNFSSMSSQIDLTMSSSSSSSVIGGGTTSTLTTVAAGGTKSMLPPIKALSSSDPLPDVVFQSQDFSTIMLSQQLNAVQTASPSSRKNSRANSQEGDELGGSFESGSGDDSSSLNSPLRTPGRGRGRGRGRGLRGGPRGHRLGRGASAVAKAIAMNRPRCVGGLKHTPDLERIKGIITPSPQVFEEDTRMSADMSQIQMNTDPQTPIRQPDFLTTNEEESQSSIISNTSVSILDPNTIAAVQNGANVKRLKKKKMEVCAAEETEYTVSSIAEYDWPPPKGCCPSKNRDTFMIQEQVANYLGIKSFKRKYPDLPRRQIDMEERNWLQEKGLVTERMCDLGITAVWASDILDIMYADFYEKYEEYKDYVRQKHVREIESKQKSLGLNINGRGLQARDRAMLSASKWNTYFNKTRKDERSQYLDLQNLMVNIPLPENVPAATIMNRSIAEEISKAASVERIAEPPTLLKPQNLIRPIENSSYYPLAVVPGQYTSTYKAYNHLELCSLPVNTVLDNPLKKEASMISTAEETDTNSETCETKMNEETSSKRLKILRSRRARSERSSKLNCDSKSEKERPISRQSGSIVESACDLDSTADSFCESSGSSSCSESSSDSVSSCTSSQDEMESDSEAMVPCAVCQRTQNNNPKNIPELFINCYTCDRKVHPSCIEMPYRMALRVRNYNWQCADCKCCIKCKRKQDQNKMLYCEQCDRGFHIYCLGIKSVPDGRWSCERCSICMRCGATKPEGLPPQQICSPNGEKIKQIKHKKVKWINEYRIDHITKLREHCSMLCVPCGRSRTSVKRLQISGVNNQGNNSRNSSLSPGFCSSTTLQKQQQQQQQSHSPQTKSQLSPDSIVTKSSDNLITPINSNSADAIGAAAATTTTTTTTASSLSSSSSSSSPPPPPVVA